MRDLIELSKCETLWFSAKEFETMEDRLEDEVLLISRDALGSLTRDIDIEGLIIEDLCHILIANIYRNRN